jgi:hypothetical protein
MSGIQAAPASVPKDYPSVTLSVKCLLAAHDRCPEAVLALWPMAMDRRHADGAVDLGNSRALRAN